MTKKLEWGLRFLALIFTVLCSVVLKDLGEIRPIYIMVINGLIMALILNAGTFNDVDAFRHAYVSGVFKEGLRCSFL